jgi:hypothetical protein
MNDEDFLKQSIRALEASVASFSPCNKRESERWVAESFVRNLHVKYDESEIVSPLDDPPDVEFRDARFEIKEILDPKRRRHDEYRQELERAKHLTDPKELFRTFEPKDISLEEIYRRCEDVANSLVTKYPAAVRSQLDLLLYVNLLGVMYVSELPYPDTAALASAGWRSVSFVKEQLSCCFHARSDAPSFIREAVGRVSHLHPTQNRV